ncbi:MAG: hypothetical protein RJA44_1723 [Pseudomonadota bacterium]
MKCVLRCLAAGLTLWSAALPVLAAQARADWLFGQWSQSPVQCAEPWFEFRPDQALIRTDADGEKVSFPFPAPRYLPIGADQVQVDFRRPHGLGATAGPTRIDFSRSAADRITLMRTRGPGLTLVRCP